MIQVGLSISDHRCHYEGLSTKILLFLDNRVCTLVCLGECVCLSDWMRPLGEAVYPTDRQVVCRLSIMAKGHCAWGVFVCNLPFTLLSFFLSFFFLCQLTHPFQESPLCLPIFLCYRFPSKMPKLGLSYCKLVQNIAKGTPRGCSTVWHFSSSLQ